MFIKILRSSNLPVAYKNGMVNRNQHLNPAKWVVSTWGPDHKHLTLFIKVIESYFYLANSGKWIKKRNFLVAIPDKFIRRLSGAVLYVYKGEWGLPSIDFDCLRTLCAVKFTRAPIEINTSGNPFWSGAGKLPYLKIGPQKLVGYRKINGFLKSEGFSLNAHLNVKQKNLSMAYDNLVFQKLNAYYFYYMYGNPTNFDLTRALYSKRTPFPFNFYYPGKYFQEAQDVIDVFSSFHIYDKIEDHDTDQILLDAKSCINLLSKKLGNQIWFFGDHYSELDAIVYAYISIIFHVKLPQNPLKDHIKESKNLVVFINRITKDIFRDEGFSTKPNQTSPEISSNSSLLTKSEREFADNMRKTQILAGLGACVAMGTYAAYTGLLKLSFDRNHQQQIPIEEDDELGSD